MTLLSPHLKPSVDHSVDQGVDLLDPVHAGAHQLGAGQPPLPDPGGEADGAVEEDLIGHGRQTSPRAPPIESRETEVRDEIAEDAEAEGNPPPETEEMILQLHVDTEVSLERVKMSIVYRDSQDSAERELDISVSPTHAAEAWDSTSN